MSQVTKVVGKPCNASEGKMNNSEGSPNGGKRNLANGHAKGGSWPSGAHETGVSGSTDKMGRHGSPLD